MTSSRGQSVVVIVDEATKVGEARRRAVVAGRAAWDLTRRAQGKAALVVTEAASNLLKHAGGGELIVQGLDYEPRPGGLEILALDSGRGMSDVGRCLADGYSTAGSPGTGLGAISRLADCVRDLFQSRHGDGPVGSARSNAASREPRAIPRLELGVVSVAGAGRAGLWRRLGDDRARRPHASS